MNLSLSVSIKYGIYITLSLIAYFLVLRLFDLHENPWLRIVNGAFMCYGIYNAIKYYKLTTADAFTYINGIKTGLITGFLTTVAFTIFVGRL